MLDSTNRSKRSQRRLVRKRSTPQPQSAKTARPSMGHPAPKQPSGQQPLRMKPNPAGVEGQSRMQRPKPVESQSGVMRRGRANAPKQPAPKPRASMFAPKAIVRRPVSVVNPAANRSEHSSATNRLNPQPRKPGSEQPKSAGKPRQRTSPLVYLCRLLILGIGVGAIAGTVISIWDPSTRYPATANQTSDLSKAAQQSNLNPMTQPGALTTITSVRLGREMTDLVTKITPLTQGLTDLAPGVFLIDLDNGNFFSFNGSNTFSAASMIKLPILVAFFQDVDAGKIKLDETLSLQQADIAEGSGDMQYSGAGTQFTALETVTNMIIISDNTATNMIIRRLGGIETLNRRFQQWGLQQTVLRKPLPDLEGTNTTSPKELVSLLALLNEGKLISMKSRDRAFEIMRRTVTDTLLPSVLSPGSTIAHKTGDIGSLVGDVGVIDLPSGRRYAVAMMVKRPHNDSRAQDLIRQMAAVVYEQFGGQPVLPPSPTPPAQLPQQTAPGVPAPAAGVQTPGMVQPSPMAPNAVPQAVPQAVPGTVPQAAPGTVPAAPTTPEAVAPTPVDPEPVSPEAATEAPAATDDASEPAATDGTETNEPAPEDMTVLPDAFWGGGR